ncbi:unnamed protein product [Linum trigynum]|uniref:RNase H type-1 domain-containing protein n=1 Tax=Linum trigynum TaxID=586398 RepID=A0AAV2GEM4_9ROSI
MIFLLSKGRREIRLHSRKEERRRCRWTKPIRGVLKLNTDAGTNWKGEVGLGCVVRNWYGGVFMAASKTIKVRWPPDLAEGMALLFGLQKAKGDGT